VAENRHCSHSLSSSFTMSSTCDSRSAHCRDVLLMVCSGSQCLVEVSTNETFVEGSDVPSVILSAFQSVQRQRGSSVSDDGCCGKECDVSRQPTAESVNAGCKPQSTVRHGKTDHDTARGSGRHASNTHCETKSHWQPLLLVIPLRLGLSEINPVYFSAIKVRQTL